MEDEEDPKITALVKAFETFEETPNVSDDEEEKLEEESESDPFQLNFTLGSTSAVNVVNAVTTGYINSSTFGTTWFGHGSKSDRFYLSANEVDGEFVIDLTGEQPDAMPVVIKTKSGTINFEKLQAMVDRLDELLCVVEKMNADDPNFPALLTAYKHFRVVEAMARATPPPDDE